MGILGPANTRDVASLSGTCIALLLALIGGVAAGRSAEAQQQNAAAPAPVSVKGWRYENSQLGMHTFSCDPPACPSASKVVYQLLPPNREMTFEQYRRSAEPITQEMQKRDREGTRFQLLGVEDGSKTAGELSLRLFKTRRLVVARNGDKKSMVNGYVFGSRHMVSMTSTAADEKTADANFMQYSAPLWLLANDKLERQPAVAQATPQETAADAPPVAVGPDWRYEKRPSDVHMFHCQNAGCLPPSRVSYRLYAPNNALTLAQFRQEQQTVVKALEQRAPPGTRIELLDVKGDEGTGPRRMFVSKRLVTHPDGKKEYTSSSVLLGVRSAASLISSSHDQKAVETNSAIFSVVLMLLINVEPKAQQ
jgi:hypothetical protein